MGLVLHPHRDCAGAVGQVAVWTRTHDVELVGTAADAARLGVAGASAITVVTPEELQGTTDGLIALGGDGTLLGAMRLVVDRPVPVLGVNFGRLGFLAEVESAGLDDALTAMAEGRASTETRSCLVIDCAIGRRVAFNDAVIARVPGQGMVDATLSVGDRPYGHFRCDALIVATPMGSTAYNYAAGGPVVSPAAEGIIVTPSSPQNGINRTVVLGVAEPLSLELTPRAGRPVLELDGLVNGELGAGDVVRVTLRPDAGLLVRLAGSVAAERSRVKLSLLDLPVLPEELRELLPADLQERLRAE